MPPKVKKPCSKVGCPELTVDRFCEHHRKQETKVYEQQRGSASSRGYDSRWRRERVRFLKRNPLCIYCEGEGRYEAATVVDHIEPHKGSYDKFWDRANWQPLCKRHHDIKTATEDGGFGR